MTTNTLDAIVTILQSENLVSAIETDSSNMSIALSIYDDSWCLALQLTPQNGVVYGELDVLYPEGSTLSNINNSYPVGQLDPTNVISTIRRRLKGITKETHLESVRDLAQELQRLEDEIFEELELYMEDTPCYQIEKS